MAKTEEFNRYLEEEPDMYGNMIGGVGIEASPIQGGYSLLKPEYSDERKWMIQNNNYQPFVNAYQNAVDEGEGRRLKRYMPKEAQSMYAGQNVRDYANNFAKEYLYPTTMAIAGTLSGANALSNAGKIGFEELLGNKDVWNGILNRNQLPFAPIAGKQMAKNLATDALIGMGTQEAVDIPTRAITGNTVAGNTSQGLQSLGMGETAADITGELTNPASYVGMGLGRDGAMIIDGIGNGMEYIGNKLYSKTIRPIKRNKKYINRLKNYLIYKYPYEVYNAPYMMNSVPKGVIEDKEKLLSSIGEPNIVTSFLPFTFNRKKNKIIKQIENDINNKKNGIKEFEDMLNDVSDMAIETGNSDNGINIPLKYLNGINNSSENIGYKYPNLIIKNRNESNNPISNESDLFYLFKIDKNKAKEAIDSYIKQFGNIVGEENFVPAGSTLLSKTGYLTRDVPKNFEIITTANRLDDIFNKLEGTNIEDINQFTRRIYTPKFGGDGSEKFVEAQVIPTNKDGYASGQLVDELFDGFDLNKLGLKKVDSPNGKIYVNSQGNPLTDEDVLNIIHQPGFMEQKTINDGIRGQKEKAINRIGEELMFLNETAFDLVDKNNKSFFNKYSKSIKPIEEYFPNINLNDVESNILFLQKTYGNSIPYENIEAIAKDPKKMSIILNKYHINEGVVNRGTSYKDFGDGVLAHSDFTQSGLNQTLDPYRERGVYGPYYTSNPRMYTYNPEKISNAMDFYNVVNNYKKLEEVDKNKIIEYINKSNLKDEIKEFSFRKVENGSDKMTGVTTIFNTGDELEIAEREKMTEELSKLFDIPDVKNDVYKYYVGKYNKETTPLQMYEDKGIEHGATSKIDTKNKSYKLENILKNNSFTIKDSNGVEHTIKREKIKINGSYKYVYTTEDGKYILGSNGEDLKEFVNNNSNEAIKEIAKMNSDIEKVKHESFSFNEFLKRKKYDKVKKELDELKEKDKMNRDFLKHYFELSKNGQKYYEGKRMKILNDRKTLYSQTKDLLRYLKTGKKSDDIDIL